MVDITVAVLLLFFVFFARTFVARSFGGGAPGDPQIQNVGPKFWPFDREYLENL